MGNNSNQRVALVTNTTGDSHVYSIDQTDYSIRVFSQLMAYALYMLPKDTPRNDDIVIRLNNIIPM